MCLIKKDECVGEDIVFLATDINLPGAVDWVMMQSCFGHHFMLVLEKQERLGAATPAALPAANAAANANLPTAGTADTQLFYAVVQLIGTRKQAEQFVYRLGTSLYFGCFYVLFLCPFQNNIHMCILYRLI